LNNFNWFEEEIFGFKNISLFILGSVVLYFILSVLGLIFLTQVLKIEVADAASFDEINIYSMPVILLIGAILEEIIFRLIPLGLSMVCWGKSYKVFVVAILSSVVFGWGHNGFEHVFIQGWGGIIFSIVFLKAGGFQEKFFKATFCCTIAHFSFNAILFVLQHLPK